MRDSIFYSSCRALFVTIFSVLGIAAGLFLILIFLGVFAVPTSEEKITYHFKEEILPNANWKREILGADSPVILQINISGVIGTELLSLHTVKQLLIESREEALKNNRVKGILLNLNTPGGTVFDADGIYEALKEYKAKFNVPIYAYVDGMCASGGVYVSAVADKIYASDTSLIGSVGVLLPSFTNFSKLMDKIGVESLTISAGKDKDAMNPMRPWTPGEQQNYQDLVTYYYDTFVSIVVSNRPKMSRTKLIQEYGARVFPAPEALEKGYIDFSGASREDVLKSLATELGLEDDKYQVVELQTKDWWSAFVTAQSPLLTGVIHHNLKLPSEIDPSIQNQFLYLYQPK